MLKVPLLACLWFLSAAAASQERPYGYVFFANSRMPGDYFFSQVSSAGNASIRNKDGKLPVSDSVYSTPGNSLLLEFVNGTEGYWKATVFKPQLRGQDHFRAVNYLSLRLMKQSVGIPDEQ